MPVERLSASPQPRPEMIFSNSERKKGTRMSSHRSHSGYESKMEDRDAPPTIVRRHACTNRYFVSDHRSACPHEAEKNPKAQTRRRIQRQRPRPQQDQPETDEKRSPRRLAAFAENAEKRER